MTHSSNDSGYRTANLNSHRGDITTVTPAQVAAVLARTARTPDDDPTALNVLHDVAARVEATNIAGHDRALAARDEGRP